jgi:transmembrane sensor
VNTASDEYKRIEDAAADWLAERSEGFTPARAREFADWCRRDPRHATAVAQLEAACALLEKMPLVRSELQPVLPFPGAARPAKKQTGPRVWRLAAGLAAAVALVASAAWWQTGRAPAAAPALVYTTSAGGYERIVLADGSVLELNDRTEVRVDLQPRERRLALVVGEAHFTVAPDAARPFIVSAGGMAVRAVGTAFNVRIAAAAVEVLVTEGRVAVAENAGPALAAGPPRGVSGHRNGPPTSGGPTLLGANERLVVPKVLAAAAPAVEKISPETVRAALAWQERKLVFSETPLREVVAQFNRRNRLQLLLGDAALAARPVGGTFAADNVEGFVRLLEGSGTIAVERRDETTVILRAAR